MHCQAKRGIIASYLSILCFYRCWTARCYIGNCKGITLKTHRIHDERLKINGISYLLYSSYRLNRMSTDSVKMITKILMKNEILTKISTSISSCNVFVNNNDTRLLKLL